MKTPRVEFTYSWIYDHNWQTWLGWRNKKKIKSPSPREVQNYIKKVEPLWRKHEKKILSELARVTGLSWHDKTIRCYVIGRCIPFSEPLTMYMAKNTNDFIDDLTHELIHQL